MTQQKPHAGEISESEIVFRSPGGWITVRREFGGEFTWAERKHVHSVAVIAIRLKDSTLEIQLHSERNPAHLSMRDLNWGVCGGRMDKEKSPIEVARDELREEGGFDCPIERIYDCGKVFATTQSSEHVFLFVADVTGLPEQQLQLEVEEMKYGHTNEWVSIAEGLNRSEDPRLICCLARFEMLHQSTVFGP